ncbi:MAG: PD-(D/E)XK nuclease family protein, partial [Bacteroidota bacterium]
EETIPFSYSSKNLGGIQILTKSGTLWGTERETALIQGNLIHYILGKIQIAEDLDKVLTHLTQNGDIAKDETVWLRKTIRQVIHHPQLEEYFAPGNQSMNEREIILPNGGLMRPDRVVVERDTISILDYKTGEQRKSHKEQLQEYARIMEKMGYAIKNKILVYITDQVTLEYLNSA